MDAEQEQAHLARAEAEIADAHARIDHQRTIIAHLEALGQSTVTAKSVLQTMLESLEAMEDHRALIKRELERQRAARASTRFRTT